MHTETDVLIVGYGPVGQFLALKLADKGWDVTVVERWPNFYPLPRAVHFDHEVARLLQSIGVRSDTNPIIEPYDNMYAWRNAEKKDLLLVDWSGIGPSGWHTSNFFSQPELEGEMHRLVEADSRITVLRGWDVRSVIEDPDGVTVSASAMSPEASGSMASRTFRAKYVVGCDGANSMIRQAMGVESTDLGFEFDWLILDMIPNEPMTFDPPAWQWCNPDHPTTIVPGGPGRRRWEFMRLPGETIEELNTEETAWARLKDWGLTPENSVLERHAVYTFRARWAERWRKGRLMIAGDAAHLMPPFAGQGMCAGLRDAYNLQWKLDRVLAGRSDDSLLDTYGPERTEHVKYFINFSMGLGQVICISDPAAAAERDKAMMAAIEDPSLAPSPPPPPGLGDGLKHEGDPAAGYLSIQNFLRSGDREARFDDLAGYGWFVLTSSAAARDAVKASGSRWLDEPDVRVVAIGTTPDVDLTDVNGAYAAWFAELGAEVVIVRPAFYVYAATSAAEAGEVMDGLAVGLRSTPSLAG